MPPQSKRGIGFSDMEMESLLNLIEQVLPIGGVEWDTIEREHATTWPQQSRTKESLRRKFQSLYRQKIPTGDPNCPPNVRRAKHIHYKLKEKTEMSDGDDDDDELGSDPSDESSVEVDSTAPPVAEVVQQASVSRQASVSPLPTRAELRASVASIPTGGVASSEGSLTGSSKKKKRPSPKFVSQIGSRKKKAAKYGGEDDDFSMSEYLKMMMLQREQDRQDERQRRTEEREEEREHRKEEAKQRAASLQQQQMFQQMLMMQMFGSTSMPSLAMPSFPTDDDEASNNNEKVV